ncbi:Synaptosomal-associated protein 29 [Operophtera brumata]|uniref:Synaptosomal-associated protein 29 n=1 Tax=Operophtera brumata TaxID=104452 RepID=A0A0L7L1V5_OPEBR|nr:Synaptosomal-associated protein 29 [Operophtera brumata]
MCALSTKCVENCVVRAITFNRHSIRFELSLKNRPYSESDAIRPVPPTQQCRISASSPPRPLTFDTEDLDDDVFINPRNGNDLFSTRNLEIIGYNTPRSPAGVLLSPRRERTFNFSLTNVTHDICNPNNAKIADENIKYEKTNP